MGKERWEGEVNVTNLAVGKWQNPCGGRRSGHPSAVCFKRQSGIEWAEIWMRPLAMRGLHRDGGRAVGAFLQRPGQLHAESQHYDSGGLGKQHSSQLSAKG